MVNNSKEQRLILVMELQNHLRKTDFSIIPKGGKNGAGGWGTE